MGQRICSIPGCEKSVLARGWCGTHYRRWHTHGDPGTAELLHRGSNPAPPCSLLDCVEPAVSNGMCHRHAENHRRYGHAEPVRDWPLIARLIQVGWDVTKRGCWEWRGGLNDSGYGVISAPRLGLGSARVHRLMWEMHNGPIEDSNLVVRHRCDNPPCINPDHLEVGTHEQNMQDMVDRNRSLAYSTGRYDGVCVQGRHDVTMPGALKQVTTKDKSYMACVECERDRKRKHHEKRRAS